MELLSRRLFSEKLIASEEGSRLFRGCAWLFCLASLGLYTSDLLRGLRIISAQHVPILESDIATVLLVLVAALSGLALLYGMAWHWIDTPHDCRRVLWLIVLLVGLPLGALLYYVAVYRRDRTSTSSN